MPDIAAFLETTGMDLDGFVDEFKTQTENRKNLPFLFILGAGASAASGIPMADELVRRWMKEIFRQDTHKNGRSYEEWLKAGAHGIKDFNPDDPAASYSDVYLRRFRRDRDKGYADLESCLIGKKPSYGYTILARIVSKTHHNVVVTVNFDNLVESAMAKCSNEFPQVCVHESLARFVDVPPRHPVIVKVHNGLMFGTKSTPEDIADIGGYGELVGKLLLTHTPIVIGYGGNDGSLMKALLKAEKDKIPGRVYWCYRFGDEKRINPDIVEFVTKQNGSMVGISDFDSLMVRLGDAIGITQSEKVIREHANEYAGEIKKQHDQLTHRLALAAVEAPVSSETTSPLQKAARETLLAMDRQARKEDKKTKKWWQWVVEAEAETNQNKKAEIYEEAMEALPGTAALLGNYANLLWRVKCDFDSAEVYYMRALKADPYDANILSNYAIFLTQARRDYDNAEDYYKKSLNIDPDYANNLGAYAQFLTTIRKDYDKAEEYYKLALDSDSKNANIAGGYANFLWKVRDDKNGAERLYKLSLQLDSTNADNCGNFASFLFSLGRYNEGNRFLSDAEFLRDERILRKFPYQCIDVEIAFYHYSHGGMNSSPISLRRLKGLIEMGVLSPGWDLSRNVERAVADGHPEPHWLAVLADVISGKTPPSALDEWPEWKALGSNG